jgi:hypothetical protein
VAKAGPDKRQAKKIIDPKRGIVNNKASPRV